MTALAPLPALPAAAPMQRSSGRAAVVLRGDGALVRLERLATAGSGKAILPAGAGPVPEVVFLNTSGGLTSGDRLALSVTLAGAGARAVATTQTAERAYAAPDGPARVQVTAEVGAGARLDWLPQETILFEGSHLARETRIALAGDASCLLAETLILGRHAMGEEVRRARLHDRRHVTRDGRPVWIEALAFGPDDLAVAAAPAMLAGARALAVAALIAPGAEDAVGRVRAVLDEAGVRAAASGFGGKCVVRMAAADGWPLRRQMQRVLVALGAAPLPRVWQR